MHLCAQMCPHTHGQVCMCVFVHAASQVCRVYSLLAKSQTCVERAPLDGTWLNFLAVHVYRQAKSSKLIGPNPRDLDRSRNGMISLASVAEWSHALHLSCAPAHTSYAVPERGRGFEPHASKNKGEQALLSQIRSAI
mgnify:CR=1 FL=1